MPRFTRFSSARVLDEAPPMTGPLPPASAADMSAPRRPTAPIRIERSVSVTSSPTVSLRSSLPTPTTRTGPATDLLAVAIDAVVHQPERRVDGSTPTARAPSTGRPRRRGPPTTVTFLTGTSRRDFADESKVRTHDYSPPKRRHPNHRRKLPPISPMLRIDDRARSVHHPNWDQRRREGTRREPHCVRKADGADIATRSPPADVCGGFGLRTCSPGDGEQTD